MKHSNLTGFNFNVKTIAKAVALASVLPMSTHAAIDPNFPTFGDNELYLNHVDSASSGSNLIPNPAFGLCMSDIEASVYTLSGVGSDVPKSGDLANIDCAKDVMWSWIDAIKGGGTSDTAAETHYAPADATIGGYKAISRYGNPTTLRNAISATNASEIYIQYDYQTSSQNAATVKLVLDSGEVIIETLPDDQAAWTTSNYIHTFDSPYTGNVNIVFTSKVSDVKTEQIRLDNVFLATDAQFSAPSVDSDGDGLSDDDETNIYLTNPNIADTDGDNLSDGDEVNTHGTDPLKQDSDDDTYNDDIELAAGTDPLDGANFPGDLDSDGVNDDSDDFPDDISASVDSDSDGYPDAFNDGCDTACQQASTLTIDAFPLHNIAYADMDADGQPDGFILDHCKEGGVTEGADLASCEDLTLDLDTDGDGDSNADEIAAGSLPGNPDSTLLDLDGDSWANDNDAYSKLALLSHPTTNALLSHGYDADSNTEAWTTFGSSKLAWTADIVNVTGHDESATNVFHLLAEDTEGKNLSHRGPILTPSAGEIIQQVRLAGWVKIDVADGITPSKILFRIANTHDVTPDTPKGTSFTAITLTSEEYYNQGWVYVEKQLSLPAAALSTQIQLLMNQDLGVEVWFDDLELNIINNGDVDEDLLIDALDLDDDNDDVLDGVDESPLGDAAQDSDGDTILDGYDDDVDNDLMVNAFDANFNPVITNFDLVESEDSTTVTALTNDLDADDTLTYTWTINGNEQIESSNTLIINHSDHDSGRQLLVNAAAFDGTDTSAIFEEMVTMPGEVVNAAPFISFTVSNNDNGDQTIDAEISDLDGDEFTYQWSINGTEVDVTETSLTVVFADYNAGEVVEVSLSATDGEDSFTLNESITLNSSPELTISEEFGEMMSTLTVTATDPENDELSYTWFIDGQPQTDGSGEYIASDSLEVNYFDYLAGVDITVTAVASDGLSETSTDYVVDIPAAAVEASEQYPEGKDGGATWWLLSMLFATLFTRLTTTKD